MMDGQLWQPENHPIRINTEKNTLQKFDFTNFNPVQAEKKIILINCTAVKQIMIMVEGC